MKLNKQIAALTVAAMPPDRRPVFPAYNRALSQYREALTECIRANFGTSIKVEYDDDDQTFYFELSEGTALAGFDRVVRVECTFEFDPGKDATAEFDRLAREIEQYRAACIAGRVRIEQLRFEQREAAK